MKRIFAILLVLAIAVSLAACAESKKPGETANVRTVTDGAGRKVEIPDSVEKIVCIGVGALRYTCYMQGQDLVVGVEEYETKGGYARMYNYVNFDKFKDLPVIGGNGDPFVEPILSVGPQVIILSKFSKADPDDLQKKTGIPVIVVPGSDTTLDDNAYRTIEILGEVFHKEERARELRKYLKGIEEDLQKRIEGVTQKPSVYVGGVSFKGQHGFEGTEANYGPFKLIDANNLANTTGQNGAFNIDLEQVLQWDPQVIFLDFNGLSLIKEDYAKNPGYYNSLTAVKEGRVYSQISFRSFASNLETALADAYYAATILYPQQFSDVNIEEKTAEIFQTLLGSNPYPDLKEAGYEFRQIKLGA